MTIICYNPYIAANSIYHNPPIKTDGSKIFECSKQIRQYITNISEIGYSGTIHVDDELIFTCLIPQIGCELAP